MREAPTLDFCTLSLVPLIADILLERSPAYARRSPHFLAFRHAIVGLIPLRCKLNEARTREHRQRASAQGRPHILAAVIAPRQEYLMRRASATRMHRDATRI